VNYTIALAGSTSFHRCSCRQATCAKTRRARVSKSKLNRWKIEWIIRLLAATFTGTRTLRS